MAQQVVRIKAIDTIHIEKKNQPVGLDASTQKSQLDEKRNSVPSFDVSIAISKR